MIFKCSGCTRLLWGHEVRNDGTCPHCVNPITHKLYRLPAPNEGKEMEHALAREEGKGPVCDTPDCTDRSAVYIDGHCTGLGIDLCRFHAQELIEQMLLALGTDRCEHGVIDGEYCLPCNKAYKQAIIDNEDE